MQPELTGKEGERREKGSKVVELRSQGTASSLTEGAAPQFNWRPPHPLFTQRESQNVRILHISNSQWHTQHLKGGKRCSSRLATLSIFQPCSWWPVHSSTVVPLCIQSKIDFEVGELPM